MKASTTIVLLLTSFVCGYLKAGAQTASGVVNSYYQVTAINTTANSITVTNASGLTPGQRVLIIQAKGAAINGANASTFGTITAINDAGNYEVNTICTIAGNTVVFKATLLNPYDPTGLVQLVTFPSYASVVVSGTVTSTPWNPATGTGGVVVLEARDSIYLNANIDVRGQGFLGGALVNYAIPPYDCEWYIPVTGYYLSLPASGDYTGGEKGEGITAYIAGEEYGMGKLANGGGGGNNNNTGGAGGGNYGAGGAGGQRVSKSVFDCQGAYPGIGGVSLATYGYSTAFNRIFFGGGGGSGHENNGVGLPGGNGGGIIILSAPAIIGGGGQLLASGVAPLNPTNTDPTQAEGDGGGGGGAGGAVVLNATSITGAITVQAQGANGSNSSNLVDDCTGPGGGGGGGAIWTAGGSIPAAISASVTGGSNGVVSAGNTEVACKGLANGATPGGTGVSQAGYVLPESATNVCVPLALSLLKYFTGVPVDQSIQLKWELNSPSAASTIQSFTIERSTDQSHFTDLTTIAASVDSITYRYTDNTAIGGTLFYRLVWLNNDGQPSYSQILAFDRPLDPSIAMISLEPNPVRDQLSVNLFSTRRETASLRLFAAQGQLLTSNPISLQVGKTSVVLPVSDLSAGTYFLVVETKERREVKPFIKK
jgi:Secretion system C-terminal sorting domain